MQTRHECYESGEGLEVGVYCDGQEGRKQGIMSRKGGSWVVRMEGQDQTMSLKEFAQVSLALACACVCVCTCVCTCVCVSVWCGVYVWRRGQVCLAVIRSMLAYYVVVRAHVMCGGVHVCA